MHESLFGTDGIRGKANEEPLTPELLVKIGKAIAVFFRQKNHGLKKIVIGKDTRLSGYLLETALTSGIVSMGVNVLLVGPMPTPAIAHLTKSLNADAGIVISASHNQAQDNGVKIFGQQGIKLGMEDEREIEKIFFENNFEQNKNGIIGKAFRIDDARGRYIEFAKASIGNDSLKGLKIVVDCANGAAYSLAEKIFSELGAQAIIVSNKPNGENINLACGAVYPEVICGLVKKHKANVGIAFDGDADRVVFCDEKGQILAGEQAMGIFAIDLQKNNKLKNNVVVTTILANSGFLQAMKNLQISVKESPVGDKNLIEEMQKQGAVFGAEPSGHVIFSENSTTGDGLIASLKLLKIMKKNALNLSELKKCVKLFPNANANVKVKEKIPFEEMKNVHKEITEAQKLVFGNGKVVARYSGTEKIARIMVESASQKTAQILCLKISNAIKNEIGEQNA